MAIAIMHLQQANSKMRVVNSSTPPLFNGSRPFDNLGGYTKNPIETCRPEVPQKRLFQAC